MLRIAKTENGLVQGLPGADARNTVFRGIPFAANTSGENRWRPPQPAESWEGVRECFQFPPISNQKTPGLDPNAFYSKEWHVDPEVPMSEDGCLSLNIWTPAKSADEKLPVMIWIFGGGLQEGYSYEMEFDGESLNRRGVILVSIGYRLNVFGFLAHPELRAENPDAPANFGLLDQKAGIEWVKRNIANFGGDPDNITIFGQSAGAGSTFYHCTAPSSNGLFQKAIAQSGGGIKPVYPNMFLPSATTLEEAEAQGERFVRDVLGCSSIAEARKLDADFISKKYAESGFFWQPAIDGKYVLGQWYERILSNELNDVKLMIGNTTDEFPFPAQEPVEEFVREKFGKHADAYLDIIRKQAGDDPEALKKAAGIRSAFAVQAAMAARVQAKHGLGWYYYQFAPTIPGDDAGVFHSSDLWFTFETLQKCWRPFDGHHYDLARKMCNYWANFAKTGDPNGNDADGTPMPEWKPFSEDYPCEMFFGDEIKVGPQKLDEKTQFLVDINLAEYTY